MNKTKLIILGVSLLLVVAGLYFKIDIAAALNSFTAVEAAVEKSVSE